jgi:acetolactate synthase-1/2/3 large subunit
MFDLDRPVLDWLSIAKGLGVEAVRATTAEEFNQALARSFATPGPMLIDAVI